MSHYLIHHCNHRYNTLISGSSALPNNYTPIPIHSSEVKYDYLLKGYSVSNCPYQLPLWQAQKQAMIQTKQAFISEVNPLVQEAYNNDWILAEDPTSFDALSQTAYLFDTLVADYANGNPIPILPNTTSWSQHEYLFNVFHHFMYNGNPMQYQLGSTIFLNDVLNTLINKTLGLRTENYIIYSAHDSNLVSILSCFNAINVSCLANSYKYPNYNSSTCVFPTYASSIFFELWTDPQNPSSASVKVKYNDMTLPLCPTSDGSCDLNSFATVIQQATGNYSASDFFQICFYGLPPSSSSSGGSGSSSAFWIIVAILLDCCYWVYFEERSYRPLQSRIPASPE